jgi:malonyl-CoA decarboxylase
MMDRATESMPPLHTVTPLTTFGRLRGWWLGLAASFMPVRGATVPDRATSRLIAELIQLFADSRAQRGGEISARGRARRIAAIYRGASLAQRLAILNLITHEFAPERRELLAAVAQLQASANDDEVSRAEARLRLALDAPRATFLAQFNLLPNGVKLLVDMRADLLALLPRQPGLEVLKVEMDGLFERWFDPGFLELKRITWQSPALVLEKLMAYEAVHPIASWTDLRNRLDTDRRCYAFFHPQLPEEPLIFVEIALLKGAPDSVQSLLDETAPVHDPRAADTAIFYSISNTQKGLRGISFGNLLLKRVMEDLKGELPRLKVFATLSPLPGFRDWVEHSFNERRALLQPAEAARFATSIGHRDPATALSEALAGADWHRDRRLADALRHVLERLCARYLLREKSAGRPVDQVAQFHLGNGASLDRIFWLADTSARGMTQSYGMMVSYRYDPDEVEKNHERFLANGRLAASSRVLRLLDSQK